MVSGLFDSGQLGALVLLSTFDLVAQLCELLLTSVKKLFLCVERRRGTLKAKPAKVARGIARTGSWIVVVVVSHGCSLSGAA